MRRLYSRCTLPLSLLLLYLTGRLFDYMEWPWFNTWALVHGLFIFALPVCIVVAFMVLFLFRYFYTSRRSEAHQSTVIDHVEKPDAK
jgi:uncharacterized membrane protein